MNSGKIIWMVSESTPGCLPELEHLPRFDNRTDAEENMVQFENELLELGYERTHTVTGDDSTLWYFSRHENDLGRVVMAEAIIEVTE